MNSSQFGPEGPFKITMASSDTCGGLAESASHTCIMFAVSSDMGAGCVPPSLGKLAAAKKIVPKTRPLMPRPVMVDPVFSSSGSLLIIKLINCCDVSHIQGCLDLCQEKTG